MGQRKARRARDKAQIFLLIQAVHLVDHAVDLVGQALALGADAAEEIQQPGRARDHGALLAHRQAQFLIPVQQRRMRSRHLGTFQHADAIGEEAQRTLGGNARIQLAQAAGSGIAGVGEFLLAGIALTLVQTGEIALVHQHFPAHVDHLRHLFAMQAQGNGAHGADVGGDVFAGRTVAPRGRLDQHAVFVTQADGQAVELQFGGIAHFLQAFQPVAHPLIEGFDIFIGKAIAQRQHRDFMAHRLELRQGACPHTLCGGVGGEQFGVGGFQRLQFLEQPVIFGIRNARLVQHVVTVVVAVQVGAQREGAHQPVRRPLRGPAGGKQICLHRGGVGTGP